MFRSVSPSFANRVSQVSQIRVSQGFANTSFAVLRLFRKIRKVSQIRVFARFRKYKFRKVSQLGFSFRKVLQVSQGFRNGQFADVASSFRLTVRAFTGKFANQVWRRKGHRLGRAGSPSCGKSQLDGDQVWKFLAEAPFCSWELKKISIS